MVEQKKLAVLYHIFYEDTVDSIQDELTDLAELQTSYFFNISADAPNQIDIKKKLLNLFPDSIITVSSNKGKDIGGKLLLLNVSIQTGFIPDWFIFLHDKKSLQALNAEAWKDNLFKIIGKNQMEKISSEIATNKRCGIIAANHCIRTEGKEDGRFTGKNGALLDRLMDEYGVKCDKYDYVAGTMFWARASAVMGFFGQNNPLMIRQTLEQGNVLDNFTGTHTHSWERLFSWIVTSQGLTIKTV